MPKRRDHPSGRPIAEETEKSVGFHRIPREDFLTPGLQRRELACAIGFPLDPATDDNGDEYE